MQPHEGYQHLRVNHSISFKDPNTGAHSNSIESSWRALKAVTTSSGRRKAHILGNLARYIFNKRCFALKLNRTEEFFRLVSTLYNGPQRAENEENEEDVTEDMLH